VEYLEIVADDDVVEKYWKLIEIGGKPVVVGESVSREAFITLKREGNLVTGNGGCNAISGTYEIDPSTLRIKFSQMVTTMMACLNMEVETELKKALEAADNYSLSPDRKYLSLNRARMAPLARFEAVYMR
jgi:heat shock protein HslJ